MKKLLDAQERLHKGLRYRIFGALSRGEIDGFRPFEERRLPHEEV